MAAWAARWLASLAILSQADAWDEVFVKLPQGGKVGLNTRGPSALRVRLILSDDANPISTPLVEPDENDIEFKVEKDGDNVIGISSTMGKVLVTEAGTIQVFDQYSRMVTESGKLSGGKPLVLTTKDGQLYGRGASPDDALSFTARQVQPLVCNRATYTPYYYSTDGYGALGVVEGSNGANFQVAYDSDGQSITWRYQGALEMYFMPAPTLAAGTKAYYHLIGKPRVPPKYAFGFIASRWGWESKDYIDETLAHFREWKYPIDALICDFEWFTKESDYDYKTEGKDWYADFGYNPATFPEPQAQLADFAKKHFRFGGIRKPRLGNTNLLDWTKKQGWILPGGEPAGSWPPDVPGSYAVDRNLDFEQKAVRDWYAWQMANFTSDGVDFWWNDEGETSFFTFYWWNVAQKQALRFKSKSRRFYSLNRAWTPGMARLGATVWTGDIDPTWKDLAGTAGMMLNWIIGGAPYVACDIGGFTGETEATLLTRWFQFGVFMPMMRVHSTKSAKPHWPWLWGDDAATAIKHALELRYRLLPYHYSLAQTMYSKLSLWVRPLVLEYPEDNHTWGLTSQWLDGDLIVAPVIREDSQKEIYLPAGTWYQLAATDATKRGNMPVVKGPKYTITPAELDEIPVFAKAGAIIPLGPVIQHTDAQPGGPLEVQVYAGADGSFDFIEDDGETVTYEVGQTRTTHFEWNDSDKRLSWYMSGYLFSPGSRAFTELFVTMVSEDGQKSSEVWPLGVSGAIDFAREFSV